MPVAPKQSMSPGFTALTETRILPSISPDFHLKSKPRLQTHSEPPLPLGCHSEISLNSPFSSLGTQPQVSGQQVRSSDLAPPALPFSQPAPAGFQPQSTPAVFSSPGSLTLLPLPLSSLPPTRLPHPALGPSPRPQEVCLSIVLHFQH